LSSELPLACAPGGSQANGASFASSTAEKWPDWVVALAFGLAGTSALLLVWSLIRSFLP